METLFTQEILYEEVTSLLDLIHFIFDGYLPTGELESYEMNLSEGFELNY